jgi:hypothetical protein
MKTEEIRSGCVVMHAVESVCAVCVCIGGCLSVRCCICAVLGEEVLCFHDKSVQI